MCSHQCCPFYLFKNAFRWILFFPFFLFFYFFLSPFFLFKNILAKKKKEIIIFFLTDHLNLTTSLDFDNSILFYFYSFLKRIKRNILHVWFLRVIFIQWIYKCTKYLSSLKNRWTEQKWWIQIIFWKIE